VYRYYDDPVHGRIELLRITAVIALVALAVALAATGAFGSDPAFEVRNLAFTVHNRVPAVNPATASPTAYQWWHYTDGRPSMLLPLGQYPPEYRPAGVPARPFPPGPFTTPITGVPNVGTPAIPTPSSRLVTAPGPVHTFTGARGTGVFGITNNCGSGG
jgi:hypothetical protein